MAVELLVLLSRQELRVIEHGRVLRCYPVSTALNGPGERENSGCTPRGWHRISERFGDHSPENAVFVGRQETGEIYDQSLAQQYPKRDWILSRILWLEGLEMGWNAGHNCDGKGCDSHARYIYIHGTPDTEPMGEPRSHGCIRMRNRDVMELFEQVSTGTQVWIVED